MFKGKQLLVFCLVIFFCISLVYCKKLNEKDMVSMSLKDLEKAAEKLEKNLIQDGFEKNTHGEYVKHNKRNTLPNGCPTDTSSILYDEVKTCTELQNMNPSGCYRLSTGMDCTSHTSIATWTGTFFGDGNHLRQLPEPLFTSIGTNGHVESLVLSRSTVNSALTSVGALAGEVTDGIVNKVFVTGSGSTISSSATNAFVGGLLGRVLGGSRVSWCGVTADVTVTATGTGSKAGGLTAEVQSTSVLNVTYSKATVTAVRSTGGLIAEAISSSKIDNSFATGSTTETVGSKKRDFEGAAGFAVEIANTVEVTTCYSSGTVTADSAGARFLLSLLNTATTTNCFFQQDSPLTVASNPIFDNNAEASTATPINFASYTAGTLITAGFQAPFWETPDGTSAPLHVPVASGSVLSDPHFYPLWKLNPKKLRYSPKGEKGGVYNILSADRIQWNAKYDIYSHLPVQYPDPEYIVEAGITLSHPTGKGNNTRILIKPALVEGTQYFDGNLHVELNGQPVPLYKRIYFFGKEHLHFYLIRYAPRYVYLSTDMFYLKYFVRFISDNFAHKPKKLAKILGERPVARWPLLNMKILADEDLEDAHGLLGQTARPTSPYQPPYMDCFECFVEGKMSDYRIKGDDIFGNDFKFNQFEG